MLKTDSIKFAVDNHLFWIKKNYGTLHYSYVRSQGNKNIYRKVFYHKFYKVKL